MVMLEGSSDWSHWPFFPPSTDREKRLVPTENKTPNHGGYHMRSKGLAVFFVFGCALATQQMTSAQEVTPVTATYEVTIFKALKNGNQIDKTVLGQFYRDGRGRTRLEVEGRISISDPTTRTAVFLDPKELVAKRVTLPPASRTSRSAGSAQPAPAHDIEGRNIEGFETKGKEYTFTIPEGRMGNKAPIVQTIRTWYSEKLKMALRAESSDELSGERAQSFRALQVGQEPDASLFQVPPGYKVQEVALKTAGAASLKSLSAQP
jgi:hypothetical protein